VLQITKKVDYALIALTHLALHPGERFSARELAGTYHLSQTLLANCLKALARAELVRSVRGTKGGYELAEAPRAIAVGRVVELLEGPLQLATCIGQQPRDHLQCSVSRVCPVKHNVFRIHLQIRDVLYGQTIADLAQGAGRTGEALPVARSTQRAGEVGAGAGCIDGRS
jgi:Rrf2 family protein